MSTTYDALVSAVALAAENDDPFFTSALDTFIARAQARIARDLDTYGFVSYVTVTTSVSSPFITVPTSAIVIKSVDLNTAGRLSQLIMRTDEFLREYWPDRTSVGAPKYYARYGFDRLLVAPAPASGTNFIFSAVETPPALTSATQTNWLTQYAEHALFYATMYEACMWMKNYPAADQWNKQYADAVGGLRNEARRTRQDDNANNENPSGADNNLIKGET